MPKRVYQPSKKKKKKTSGFRVRNRTRSGRKTLKNRRSVGRRRLTH